MLLELFKLLLFQILFLFIFSVIFNLIKKILKFNWIGNVKVNQFFMPIMFIYIRQISLNKHGYSLLPYMIMIWTICLIFITSLLLIKKGNIGYGKLCFLLLKFSSLYSFVAWILIVLFSVVKWI
ncbi:DUF3397 family protein [Apilactobacillus ozensis]|uniref:DUF3397 family protein n=1 Tax=Apilactobacillus ozensis TaxID=866801 RepID=UPI003D31C71F